MFGKGDRIDFLPQTNLKTSMPRVPISLFIEWPLPLGKINSMRSWNLDYPISVCWIICAFTIPFFTKLE